jgi:hypothetical protein
MNSDIFVIKTTQLKRVWYAAFQHLIIIIFTTHRTHHKRLYKYL